MAPSSVVRQTETGTPAISDGAAMGNRAHRGLLPLGRERIVVGGLSAAPLAAHGGPKQLGRIGFAPKDTSESEPVS